MADGFIGSKRSFSFCATAKPNGSTLGCHRRKYSIYFDWNKLFSYDWCATASFTCSSIIDFGYVYLALLTSSGCGGALIVILGEIGYYRYAFFPAMIDSVLLILVGAAYSNLTGKPYPNKPPG